MTNLKKLIYRSFQKWKGDCWYLKFADVNPNLLKTHIVCKRKGEKMTPRSFYIQANYLWFITIILTSPLFSQTMLDLTFDESFEDFPNPERGFYHARSLTDPQNYDIRGENLTLIYGRVSADSFRNKPLSEEFLQAIQNGFDEARKNGIKVNPRVAYNHGPHPGAKAQYGDDAPLNIVMTHISQLKPLWIKNKDVIDVLDAGFIGGWGEWHTSSNGLDSLPNRRAILFAILDALPKDRMVV